MHIKRVWNNHKWSGIQLQVHLTRRPQLFWWCVGEICWIFDNGSCQGVAAIAGTDSDVVVQVRTDCVEIASDESLKLFCPSQHGGHGSSRETRVEQRIPWPD